MRKQGYIAGVVEKWIPQTKRRKDLFGIIDIVAVHPQSGTVGIQCTSRSNVSSRVKKILGTPEVIVLIQGGWRIVVQGWEKRGRFWTVTETDIGKMRMSEVTAAGWTPVLAPKPSPSE